MSYIMNRFASKPKFLDNFVVNNKTILTQCLKPLHGVLLELKKQDSLLEGLRFPMQSCNQKRLRKAQSALNRALKYWHKAYSADLLGGGLNTCNFYKELISCLHDLQCLMTQDSRNSLLSSLRNVQQVAEVGSNPLFEVLLILGTPSVPRATTDVGESLNTKQENLEPVLALIVDLVASKGCSYLKEDLKTLLEVQADLPRDLKSSLLSTLSD